MDDAPPMRYNLQELAGAVGDYGTLFPLVFVIAVVTDLNLGHMLLFFALWYIITGFYYRRPVPVEPMKAVGALVIVGSFTTGEIVASGIVLGLFFLALGFAGGMKWLRDKVPQSVIRGIQLGLALILLRTSWNFVAEDLLLALLGVGIILLFFYLSTTKGFTDPSSLVVLAMGLVIGIAIKGFPVVTLISVPSITLPNSSDFVNGTLYLVIPQIPLTITNSILATSLLMKDLLNTRIDPDKLSKTVGMMNLTASPLGGMPMCHGAGGLAAQYRFGARTGGSNVMSGLILIPIALFFSGPTVVGLVPLAVFGALLIFVALELGKHGLKTDSLVVTLPMAVIALLTNLTVAFAVGMVIAYALRYKKDKP